MAIPDILIIREGRLPRVVSHEAVTFDGISPRRLLDGIPVLRSLEQRHGKIGSRATKYVPIRIEEMLLMDHDESAAGMLPNERIGHYHSSASKGRDPFDRRSK